MTQAAEEQMIAVHIAGFVKSVAFIIVSLVGLESDLEPVRDRRFCAAYAIRAPRASTGPIPDIHPLDWAFCSSAGSNPLLGGQPLARLAQRPCRARDGRLGRHSREAGSRAERQGCLPALQRRGVPICGHPSAMAFAS